MASFRHLKKGDSVLRMLAGTIPQPVKVLKVKEDVIVCGDGRPGAFWEFDAATGAELDEDLNWGPPPLYPYTGSVLKEAA